MISPENRLGRAPSRQSLTVILAVAMSAYHLWTGYFGAPIPEVHYPLHLFFVLAIVFAKTMRAGADARTLRLGGIWDLVLVALAAASTLYLFVNAEYLTQRMALFTPVTPFEYAMGLAMLVVVLEAARRTVGWVLVGLLAAFLLYAGFGDYFPFALWHRGYDVGYIIDYQYLTTSGVFGVPIAVMANYVFHFVLFGSFLVASGAGSFFTDLARAVTGRTVGGPAKTAVVASTMMGMLSGSSAANVVTTGSFTIPAMRRSGYRPEFAAGVEAVASTGGQTTPPIMGAAAFIMMEFVGVSYATIMGIAIIPALLYFFAILFTVDLEARRLDLRIGDDETLPRVWDVLRSRGYLMLSVGVMIWMLIDGWTPTTAAVYAIGSLLGLLVLFDGENRRRIHLVCWEAMCMAPKMVAAISIACAVGGMLVGIISLTGLGLRLSSIILEYSGGHLPVILVMTTIMGIVLGMGMPTSGAYIILAALLAPGLVDAGVPLLAAHLFIMYVAAKSSITPPVAIASYAAAAVAGTDPWRTSLVAFRLGLPVFIIPFMFAYGPALLGLAPALEVVYATATATVGVFILSVATVGWFIVPLRWPLRVVALAAAICLIAAHALTDLLGLALFAIVAGAALVQRQRRVGAAPREGAG